MHRSVRLQSTNSTFAPNFSKCAARNFCCATIASEPLRRGPYAGAIGYLSYSGDLDTCIYIRTILVRQGRAYVQAGAGIVADSDPESEFRETENKAGAMLRAIELAATQEEWE